MTSILGYPVPNSQPLHSNHKFLYKISLWVSGSHKDGFVRDVGQGDKILTNIVLGCFITSNVHKPLERERERVKKREEVMDII